MERGIGVEVRTGEGRGRGHPGKKRWSHGNEYGKENGPCGQKKTE